MKGRIIQLKSQKNTRLPNAWIPTRSSLTAIYENVIFWIELIGIRRNPNSPELILSVGTNPHEDSKELSDDFQMFFEDSEDSEEDEYGFNDFQDGFSDDDLNSLQ